MSPLSRPDDALEILLPDADDAAVRRAREVTRFLRLLSNDAEPAHASTVGVDLERARIELESSDRSDLECALSDLLRHYLGAAVDADSFAHFGETGLDVRSAWRVLAEFELEHEWLVSSPLPGESTPALTERLIANLERLGVAPARLALWRARCTHAFEGPRAGERAYRELLRTAPVGSLTPSQHRFIVAGIAECLLERGAVRDARALLFEHLAQHGTDLRARQLLSWARLALGDAAGARALLVGLRPWWGPLPSGLLALRAAWPEWLPCLAGRAASDRPPPRDLAVRERSDVGAAVLAVFTFRAPAGASVVHLDAAPALRARSRTWALECTDAHEAVGSPEHRVIAEARTVVDHAAAEGGLRFAVAGTAARARALAPILDDDAEVAGWVYLECEHHLLPGPARLAAYARGWRTAVLLARERRESASEDESEERPPAEPEPDLEESPTARVFHALVAELGIKLYQRRWSGFSLENGCARLAGRGGEGVGFESERAGRGRALARAISTGGTIAFDEPDERLSLHAQAASGFVVPLAAEERAIGFLAVESSRRRDFKPKDIEACARAAAGHGLSLRMAQFAEWHRARFGFEPWFDPARADFRSFASHAIAAARSRSAVVLAGPAGTGKLVLARWIHFESRRAPLPFKVYGAQGAADPRTSLVELLEAAGGGTLVFDDVDELAPALQEELLRYLERVERATDREGMHEHGARIVATTKTGLGLARDAQRLRPDLAARLDRLTLLVPALAERREEIPALFTALARRFADEEGVAPPHPSDETLAVLWRQPWHENLRGLENVVYKLVLLHGGEAVEPEHLTRLARHFGLALVKKVPSRHPHPRDLVAALRTTRTSGGRVNKTRAALYLGWDPDTLVARMQSGGIAEDTLQDESAWQVHREGAAGDTEPEPDPVTER